MVNHLLQRSAKGGRPLKSSSHLQKRESLMKRIFFILLLCFISGCVVTPNKIETWMMQPSLQYRGFSVQRPNNSSWYMINGEQDPLYAIFRLDTNSETHTVNTSIRLQKIPKQPSTIEDFKKIVDDNLLGGVDDSKYVLVSYKSKESSKQGQWCIEYDLVVWNNIAMNSNQPLLMSMKGYMVIHPAWERTVVDAYFSERGKDNEMDEQLEVDGKSIIEGVVLESSPGVPING